MTKPLVAFLIASAFAAPALAAPKDDPATPVRTFIDAFNKGDAKAARATYAPGSLAIVDEFAPHSWTGPNAPEAWVAAYEKHAKATHVSDGHVTYGEPTRREVGEGSAYVVLPTVYLYKEQGRPMAEEGQITAALRSSPKGMADDGLDVVRRRPPPGEIRSSRAAAVRPRTGIRVRTLVEGSGASLMRLTILVLATAAVVTPAAAQPSASVRAEVPIREVVLSNGARRYGVPITVGSTALEAGLDTGSSGLRLVPNAVPEGDAIATGRSDSYSYGAGAKLDGEIGRATVAVGALSGTTTLQLVRKVGCTAVKPTCAAGSIPVAQYGIQGDGLPGEGFKAILGVNMASAEIPGLFAGVGATRWIIELPRPGEGAPGRIVLNPTDAETAGFVALPIASRFASQKGGLHDGVAGCLKNETNGQQVCGVMLLDSGAPGIRVEDADAPRPWPNGTPASLTFADGAGRVAAVEHLSIGQREHASNLTMVREPQSKLPEIFAGLSPYFAFSVLYDPAHGTVALKPRSPAAGGPQGVLAAR